VAYLGYAEQTKGGATVRLHFMLKIQAENKRKVCPLILFRIKEMKHLKSVPIYQYYQINAATDICIELLCAAKRYLHSSYAFDI